MRYSGLPGVPVAPAAGDYPKPGRHEASAAGRGISIVVPLVPSGNAAYWFRRVGEHPVFAPLAEEARALGLRLPSDRWDPFAFIDLCEKHRDSGTPDEDTLRRVQRREWELLFDWCYRQAVEPSRG